jgi:hypothetical protein
MVGLDAIEAHRSEDRVKSLVPNPASLLQSIERLPEPADMVWTTNFKSLRLLHVDLFLKGAIEIALTGTIGY